jgi:two-component system, chemotaxis family, sensor kinase CheA
VGEGRIATVRGRRLPLVNLAALLGLAATPNAAKLILLKPARGAGYALEVDDVHDHEELVVKPAAPPIMSSALYAGTTLGDDGRPILLLDPSGIAARAGFAGDDKPEAAPVAIAPQAAAAGATLLLFRGLDGRARALPIAVVERIEDVPAGAIAPSAGRLRVTTGDRILPVAGCTAAPSRDRVRILRLTDGAAPLAYAFGEVIDIRTVPIEVQPAPLPGEIAGVALIAGEPVELLDPHWLFASCGDAAKAADRPRVCAIPERDPWMQNMLRPLVEGLGYRVVAERAAADIVIASAEDEGGGAVAEGCQMLRLRSQPERQGENDNSIYRYDRAALIAALSGGAGQGGAHG